MPSSFFLDFSTARAIYGSSQTRGRIRDEAAGLHHSHSHSNVGLELCWQPIAQLSVTPDP